MGCYTGDNKMTTEEAVKKIKQSFRLYMNGVTAQSIRDKGVGYKLAWGVSQQHLREMASEYEKSFSLAVELWKSDVRECKILATMLMPAEKMPRELVDIWMEQLPSQEMGEQMVFHLLQHVGYAPQLAYEWISREDDMYQIIGYTLIGRLFMNGSDPNERGINEFIDQAAVAMKSENPALRHAAMNAVVKFGDMDEAYERMTQHLFL